VVDERLVPVREAGRHEQGIAGFLVEFDGAALLERRRVGPQIDDRIEDTTPYATHELRLGMRLELQVHAAQRPRPLAAGKALLREFGRQTGGRELIDAEGTSEESTRVSHALQPDQTSASERQFQEFHAAISHSTEMKAVPAPDAWHGRRVLVTGHTGFKGAWLCARLLAHGARVTGVALAPEGAPNLWTAANLEREVESHVVDLRDAEATERAILAAQPEIVLHLAAQAIVRRGYREPVLTYATNVMGTVHVLDALRRCASARAVVVVTSDKVYADVPLAHGYAEDARLGEATRTRAAKRRWSWWSRRTARPTFRAGADRPSHRRAPAT